MPVPSFVNQMPPQQAKSVRRSRLLLIQIIGTIICGWWLVRSVDLRALLQAIGTINWWWFLAACGLHAACHILNVRRWQALVSDPRLTLATLLSLYGLGFFSNNLLPSGIGGDAVRAGLLARRMPVIRATTSVVLDRMIGTLGLLGVLAILPFIGIPPVIADQLNLLTQINLFPWFLTALIGIVLLSGIGWSQRRWIVHQWAKVIVRLFEGAVFQQPIHLVFGQALALSVLSQALLTVSYWCVLNALTLSIEPGAAVWLVFGVTFATLVPLTVNGLGLQEGIFVAILANYGVNLNAALGVALLVRALQVLYGLVGAFIYLLTRRDYAA
jgi:glycosyltransferase 2 family protein